MLLLPFKYSIAIFSYDFFQKNQLPPFYKFLHNNTNNEKLINDNFFEENDIGNTIHEIKFIPSYFNLIPIPLELPYKLIKFNRVDNFRINLDGFKNADDYLENQMGPKSRSQLRRRINRLETCFSIKYNFYYGDISKQKYDFLFNALEVFIERRFNQRGDLYSLRHKWDFIKEQTYQLILTKKASLFVIYDEHKPIDICLSYHFQNIMQHLIRSYDIDYSKFWVGQIDIFKQIDWCFSNNFKIFDLMWGELDYKIRWSNEISVFEHHFIFKNNHPLKTPFVNLMIRFYKIKDVLSQTRFYKSSQKRFYKSIIKAKTFSINNLKSKDEKKEPVITVEDITKMPLIDTITAININDESYKFLRKSVYDFQYIHFENTTNIKVFKINSDTNSYLIQGAKSQIKVFID